jgi:hypothetical protein
MDIDPGHILRAVGTVTGSRPPPSPSDSERRRPVLLMGSSAARTITSAGRLRDRVVLHLPGFLETARATDSQSAWWKASRKAYWRSWLTRCPSWLLRRAGVGGAIWDAVIAVIGGWVVGIITSGISDDVFTPGQASVEISSPDFHWGDGTKLSPEETVTVKEHDGKYQIVHYWEVAVAA